MCFFGVGVRVVRVGVQIALEACVTGRYEHLVKDVKIALVGKYTGMEDAYCSVVKSLWHSCLRAGRKLTLVWIEATDLEDATKQRCVPRAGVQPWSSLLCSHGAVSVVQHVPRSRAATPTATTPRGAIWSAPRACWCRAGLGRAALRAWWPQRAGRARGSALTWACVWACRWPLLVS